MANLFSVTVKLKALRMRSDWCIKLSRTQETKVPRPYAHMQVYQLCMCTSGEVDDEMYCVLHVFVRPCSCLISIQVFGLGIFASSQT